MTNKSQQLKELALSCFNQDTQEELDRLLSELNITLDEVVNTYIDYDLDIFSYHNEIYDSLVMRVVLHIHNLLKGSWHIERQDTINDFINVLNPSSIMDIGFGVPSLYVKEALKKSIIKITLSDFAEPAINFAKTLLSIWNPNWHNQVSLACEDMVKVSFNPPKHDVYLFQDSIEHVEDPTACLMNFVRNSSPEAKFILSIPLGPLIPMHFMAWDSSQEAVEWLQQCGLKITMQKQVRVNPEVDLFAEQHNFCYVNLIVLCEKV